MADVMLRFDERRLATFVAVVALLVQQGLLPVLHFALGAQLSDRMHVAAAGHHAHQSGNGESNAPGDTNQGPCHFCRILGATLPPPPVAEFLRLAPTPIAFAHSAAQIPPVGWTSRVAREG
jgi:hypothetical protein